MTTLIWIAFAAAQLADVLTTRRFLALGIREASPWWRWVQAHLGWWWWVPRLVVAWALAGGLQWWAGSVVLVAVMAVAIGGVAVWNWRQIGRRG
ncbi:hypothetical protein [Roseovarius ramblicola]|uniref:DUF5658 domain-containing protein n=1 Tax=Roseovarius ramblicola TaxID=2022336 RepID=A0ABV5HYV7_9RHOB